MTTSTAEFHDWLISEHRLAESTADIYTRMVDFGLARGDATLAVRKARTRGSLKVAAAALRAWGRWANDKRLISKVGRIASHRVVETTDVKHVTEAERKELAAVIPRLEEPYRSAMTLVVHSGLRLSTVLDLSRTQVEVGGSEYVPIIGSGGDVVGMWEPSPAIREAFCTLTQYGGWDRVRDLFGRDYVHAYKQIRILLRYLCRKAGGRQVRPSELVMPGSPIQAPILDEEVRCA